MLKHDDLKAVNTFEDPHCVAPNVSGNTVMNGNTATTVLRRQSRNAIRFAR